MLASATFLLLHAAPCCAVLCHRVQGALSQLDEREAEEARQKEQKKREAEAALKVCVCGARGMQAAEK